MTGGGVVGYTGSLTCGVAKSSSRIVGRQLSNKVVPWLAGLRLDTGNSRGKIFCGGSLVSSRYVLTAAHCVWQNQNPDKQLKVVLGELDPQNEDGNEMTVGVRKVINDLCKSRHTIAVIVTVTVVIVTVTVIVTVNVIVVIVTVIVVTVKVNVTVIVVIVTFNVTVIVVIVRVNITVIGAVIVFTINVIVFCYY